MILPDVRGLYRFYEELALRFAERGYPAIAIDYFGRTAGIGKRGEDFGYMPHAQRTTPVREDVAAAADYVRSQGAETLFTVGFCFGGRSSWLAAADGHGLAGAVGFYGRPGEGRDGAPGPAQRVSEIAVPIWRCRRARIRTSRLTTTPHSSARSQTRAWSTSLSPTMARPIAFSIASRKSSRPRQTMRGRTLEFIEHHGR